MNSDGSQPKHSPEYVVSDLRPEQVRAVVDAVMRAAAGGNGKSLQIATADEAERLMARVIAGLCRSHLDTGGKGLYRHVGRLVDRSMVGAVLDRVDGCQVKAARLLGISRNTLRSKMRGLGIDSQDYARRSSP